MSGAVIFTIAENFANLFRGLKVILLNQRMAVQWRLLAYNGVTMRWMTIVLIGCLGSVGLAQTTQPAISQADLAASEFRATQAMSGGQYSVALPLLQHVALGLTSKPDQLAQVNEQIRVCQKNLTGAVSTPATLPSAVVALGPTGAPVDPTMIMDPKLRLPHAAPKPGQAIELQIKQLGNFMYDPIATGGIPADVQAMNGCTLRTHGYMMPMDQVENITEFAFVPSLFGCCYGQPPQVQHTIIVHTPPGKSVAKYTSQELIVEGTLKVSETKDDDFVISIFEINASSIRAAQ